MNFSGTYWVRTAVGLEEIFLRELMGKFTVKNHEISHRTVFFELEGDVPANQLCASLRTADEIYHLIGKESGIGHTKQDVKKIENYFAGNVLPLIPSSRPVRVTASFLGERNYNRYYIENLLNNILSMRANAVILSNEKGDKWVKGEFRVRVHIEDEQAYTGIGLQDKPLHRRPWRTGSYIGQLHPPLAAAMALIAKPAMGATIIDPFCGSGTILIESALQHSGLRHTGYDTDAAAITIARQNALAAGVEIELHGDDFIHHYKHSGNYILITNPPWGEKHSMEESFLENLRTIILNSRSAVVLVPEEVRNKLSATGIAINEVCITRVRGKLAYVLVWDS